MLSFLSTCLLPLSSKPQIFHDVKVTSGSTVQFIVITLDQYNTGINLIPTTTIRIRFQNAVEDFWALTVYATDDVINLSDGSGTADIPLSNLVLTPTITSQSSGTGTENILFGLVETPGDVLVSGTGANSGTLNEITLTISYKLNGSLLNKPEGLYFVGLYFQLKTHPTGVTN